MKSNDRLDALNILMQVFQNRTPLSHLFASKNTLSPLCKDICFGVCRQAIHLEAMADHLLNKRPKELDVWIILLMGLYQLEYLRTPAYAAVKETVNLAVLTKKAWAKNLINAILRRFCREQELIRTLVNTNTHPDWLRRRIQHDWPHQASNIFSANDEHPPMVLRVNSQRTAVAEYLERLANAGIKATAHPFGAQALVLETPCAVNDLPGFATGDVSVQDAAAQLAVTLLDLKPNLRILDACCAPGGKTCHLLERQPHDLECVAVDLERKRLARTQENLNRLHLHAQLIQGDACTPSTWWDGVPFDRILLDAPCSALGVIRRHPDIKHIRQEQDINTIIQLQHTMLRALWPLLAEDGLMVYATCSILNDENEHQIAAFIQEQPNAHVIPIQAPWGHPTPHGRQILPGDAGMDGFFYAVLKKHTPR